MNLLKYDIAKAALAEAKTFDDVMRQSDKAKVMETLARIANDEEGISLAKSIQLWAKRRVGEMLAAAPKSKGGGDHRSHGATGDRAGDSMRARFPAREPIEPEPATLKEIKVSKTDSSRWQQLANIPAEKVLEAEKHGAASVSAVLKFVHPPEPQPKPKPAPVNLVEDDREELREWGQTNADTVRELMAEAEITAKVIEADDKLAAAMAEVKKLQGLNKVLQSQVNGLQNREAELIKIIKSKEYRIKKLEAEAKK